MRDTIRGLLIVLLTIGAFWPVLSSEFLIYDDTDYVTENVFVRRGFSWDNVCWAFTSFHASNWHPLTWLSLMLDAELYGLSSTGFHATNLIWHLINALLLFGLLNRFKHSSGWCAFVVAMLFAIHPLHVESVAWVAERKDVLFTAFGLLALHSYVSFARGSRQAYWLTVVFLGLSLMSKPMLVTFPFLLLLLDDWPLRRVGSTSLMPADSTAAATRLSLADETSEVSRPSPVSSALSWRALVIEKWPMFLLISSTSLVAWLAQSRGGAVVSRESIRLSSRLANAVLAYGYYLWDTFVPTGLSVVYLHPKQNISFLHAGLVLLLLLAVSAMVFAKRRQLPVAWMGWCWFLGTLVPVIGLVQIGSQQRADRYTYFPLIGIFWAAVLCLGKFCERRSVFRKLCASASVVVLAALLIMTHTQVGYWANSETLFEHALEVEPNNTIAHHNLGFVKEKQGDFGAAIDRYRQTLQIDPSFSGAQLSLAYALLETAGANSVPQQLEAIDLVERILAENPKHALANNLKGGLLRREGRLEEAIRSFQIALNGMPQNVTVRSNLAVSLFEVGRRDEAMRHFEKGRRLDPQNPSLLLNLGVVEFHSGNTAGAIRLFQQAMSASPENRQARRFFASAKMTQGAQLMLQNRYEAALKEFEQADELAPDIWQLQVNFGEALFQLGRFRPAEDRFLRALELRPDCPEAHFGLGRLYANTGKKRSAIEHLSKTLDLKPGLESAQQLLKSLNEKGR